MRGGHGCCIRYSSEMEYRKNASPVSGCLIAFRNSPVRPSQESCWDTISGQDSGQTGHNRIPAAPGLRQSGTLRTAAACRNRAGHWTAAAYGDQEVPAQDSGGIQNPAGHGTRRHTESRRDTGRTEPENPSGAGGLRQQRGHIRERRECPGKQHRKQHNRCVPVEQAGYGQYKASFCL